MYRFFSPLCLTETTELNPSLWPLCSRLSTTQNNISFCVGSSKQYQLCPDQVRCKVEMTVTKKIKICVVIPPISINLKKGCVCCVGCINQVPSVGSVVLQPCPSPHVSFKQHQCSQFNSKAFGRRYYQWVPLYPGRFNLHVSVQSRGSCCMFTVKSFLSCPADYISISNKPCDLQCTTINGERQLLVPAHDGTFCHDTKYHGVCIEGICQVNQYRYGPGNI